MRRRVSTPLFLNTHTHHSHSIPPSLQELLCLSAPTLAVTPPPLISRANACIHVVGGQNESRSLTPVLQQGTSLPVSSTWQEIGWGPKQVSALWLMLQLDRYFCRWPSVITSPGFWLFLIPPPFSTEELWVSPPEEDIMKLLFDRLAPSLNPQRPLKATSTPRSCNSMRHLQTCDLSPLLPVSS